MSQILIKTDLKEESNSLCLNDWRQEFHLKDQKTNFRDIEFLLRAQKSSFEEIHILNILLIFFIFSIIPFKIISIGFSFGTMTFHTYKRRSSTELKYINEIN